MFKTKKSKSEEIVSNLLNEIEISIKELALETDNLKKSAFFKNYLKTMSKFWKYSYRNQMLIHHKMPEATRVCGFRKWKELNRIVKKGEKALKILAPYKKKLNTTDQELKKEQVNIDVMEPNKSINLTFFIPVNVFDVSQTEGEPLPDIDITIGGDNYKDFLENLISFCKQKEIKVNFENLGINGLSGYSEGGKITIADNESINSQTNTIIHEIAHELLHKKSINDDTEGNKQLSNQQMEIQAESTAYVVTKHFGMENKSFNYLAIYHADYKKIIENLKAISRASKEIIEFLDNCIENKSQLHVLASEI